MKNNLKDILDKKGMNIKQLADGMGRDYPNTYNLVNRKNLEHTNIRVLNEIAEYLDISIVDIWRD